MRRIGLRAVGAHPQRAKRTVDGPFLSACILYVRFTGRGPVRRVVPFACVSLSSTLRELQGGRHVKDSDYLAVSKGPWRFRERRVDKIGTAFGWSEVSAPLDEGGGGEKVSEMRRGGPEPSKVIERLWV